MAIAHNLESFAKAETIDRRVAVYDGLPVKMLRALLTREPITMNDLARVIAPRRTLERRLKDGDRLNREESDRLARLLPILDLCEQIFGDTAKAMNWLRGSKRAFGGVPPLDLLATSTGSEEVNELLQQSRHGILA